MFKKVILSTAFLLLSILIDVTLFAEEGQYPLSEIKKLDLKKAGLLIDQEEIYNPDGISLIDALVKVNGCTGSFVSSEGLIITNHHCAFGAVSSASTTENNYLENGFLAESITKEIHAKGYAVRITESYEDVSSIILDAVKNIDDLEARSNAITDKMRELGEAESDKKNSIEAKVSEMFAGQSYILFKYRMIEDVRLVYVPPRSIGEFGGENDNWMWPRHTGDFTFMRAYVAPDGSSAEYSEDNVPYQPKKFLEVNPEGVKEGDFAFILGYPGKTYRNQPWQFLKYQYDYHLPYISSLYQWTINLIESKTKENEEMSLAYSSHIKRLSNTMKNYKGKLQGIKRAELLEKFKTDENELHEFITNDSILRNEYGDLFSEIDEIYKSKFDIAESYIWLSRLYRLSDYIKLANFIIENAEEKKKPDSDRKTAYKDENIEKSIAKLDKIFEISMNEIEDELLVKMICDALKFSESSRILSIDKQLDRNSNKQDIVFFVKNKLLASQIIQEENFRKLLNFSFEELIDEDIPLINFAIQLKEQEENLDSEYKRINGALSKLLPQFNEVKKKWKNTDFIPDANSTLRLTYGYIKGYSPRDALYASPITTLDGVIEKSHLGGNYKIPQNLQQLYEAKDFGQFYNKELNSIPVGLLYNMDTTGGNSGSPILDANGRLVGVNFDRAYEATINDFAWNKDYSRSIGVDIRYILWITQKLGEADYLLEEMGIGSNTEKVLY